MKRDGDYLEVGRTIGSQLLKQSIRVTTNDERAFRFLRGFFESLEVLE